MAAPTIVTTSAGTTSNSFISVADADTYFTARRNATAWTGAVADVKAVALLQAARRLQDEEYAGTVYDEDQALSWPRNSVYDRNGVWLDPTDGVPQLVKDAQCELALAFLVAGDDDLLADTGLEGFESLDGGALVPRAGFKTGKLPIHVRRILGPVLVSLAGSIRMERG